jgi:hydrogenase maturation protease
MNAPEKILVLGIGNELRGEDGIGIYLARKLKALSIPGVRVEEHSGEGTSLLERLSQYNAVLLLDCVYADRPLGEIVEIDLTNGFLSREQVYSSSHQFGVSEAVRLAGVLGKLPERCRLVGIVGRHFGYGRGFAPEVLQAVPKAIARVQQILQEWNSSTH